MSQNRDWNSTGDQQWGSSKAAGLRKMIQHDADDAKYFGVSVDSGGQPNESDLQAATAKTTLIEVRLNP